MKNLLFFTIISLLLSVTSKAQLLSYELIDHYSTGRIDSALPPGGNIFFTPRFAVDYYKITYLTPYKHIDSLVRVSGAVAIPVNQDCPAPLTGYFHGTVAERTGVPSYQSQESFLGIVLASDGYFTALPDYLGLGDSDSSVIIHPYIHAFSQGHTSVNALRSARQLADILAIDLNGQVFLTGYSQGGFTTMATHKLIQEEFSSEFSLTGSAPMSGPYDLKDAQVDLIISDSVYPTPGYLPYILLAYHSVIANIQQVFPDISKVLKSPYDSIIPPLFYAKEKSIGFINNVSTPVPKNMVVDSIVDEFANDSLHPLRMALLESHLLDWAPQTPVKIMYCKGDDQITYKNAERAFDSWRANGSPNVQKEDLGDLSHGGCVIPAVIATKAFFDSLRVNCPTGIATNFLNNLKIYPNPAQNQITIELPNVGYFDLALYEISGKRIAQYPAKNGTVILNIAQLIPGVYFIQLSGEKVQHAKLVVN